MGKVIRKYKGHRCVVQDVTCPKKTSDMIASVGDDGAVKVW